MKGHQSSARSSGQENTKQERTIVASAAMSLQYTILCACIATVWSWRWTTQMTVKNHENNPYLNYDHLGPFQNAWETIVRASNDTYLLMFRTKWYQQNIVCVSITATNTHPGQKTASYAKMYYNTTSKKYECVPIQVRALVQTGYLLENVIREGLNGKPPAKCPSPVGSNTYIKYNNYSCYSSSSPFMDEASSTLNAGTAEESCEDGQHATEGDFYVVYSQPQCNILKAPSSRGGCEIWLRESDLQGILEAAVNETRKKEEAMESKKTEVSTMKPGCCDDFLDYLRRYMKQLDFESTIFKHFPADCRFAFVAACGKPKFMVYDVEKCNVTQRKDAADNTQS